MDVGVPSQVGRRGVDGGDHAGPNVIPGGRGDELSHRLPCRLAELAEQRSVMEKVGTQELWNSERPHAVRYRLDDLLAQEGAEEGAALGGAGGAEAAAGTGEGEEVLAVAGIAEDAGKAPLEVATVEEGVDDIVDEAAPMAAGALEALLPLDFRGLVPCVDQVIER